MPERVLGERGTSLASRSGIGLPLFVFLRNHHNSGALSDYNLLVVYLFSFGVSSKKTTRNTHKKRLRTRAPVALLRELMQNELNRGPADASDGRPAAQGLGMHGAGGDP